MNLSPNTLLAASGAIGFSVLLIVAFLRRPQKIQAEKIAVLFIASGLLWSIGKTFSSFDGIAAPNLWANITLHSQILMPLIFGGLMLVFLDKQKYQYWYAALASLIFLVWLAWHWNFGGIVESIVPYFPTLSLFESWWLVRQSLISLTWLVPFSLAFIAFFQAWQRHPQAQYRNRYWYGLGGTVFLLAANIVLTFAPAQYLWIGMIANIIGGLLIAYTCISYYPTDLHFILRRILQSITVTMSISVILFLALSTAYLFTQWQVPPKNVLWWLVAMALALGFILPVIIQSAQKTFGGALFGSSDDEIELIRAYSQTIKTDWNFYLLSQQALQFILKEMNIPRGAVFVNEGDGTGHITVKLAASAGLGTPPSQQFNADNPWIQHLKNQKSPVTLYDIEMLYQYRQMDAENKRWLTELGIDTFVPMILRQNELVGVLALGAKPQHRPFSPHELRQVQAVAEQLALDLDKARLFGQLGTVNQKLGALSEEFETIDQGKTDFISIASHELRTPLTHIHGYASMLLEANAEELQDPKFVQEILAGIAKGSSRLTSVVDLISDVSKADFGKLDIMHGLVNLDEVIKEATDDQADALQERQQTLIVSGTSQLPNIDGDGARLAQAISHLINNAIKYTPDNGTITIAGREFTDDTDDTQWIEITITDTGIGIDPADKARIFSKFYRVDDVAYHSTSNVKFKGAGPGLGLPLVKGIIEAHKGKIWVESPEYNEETCPGSQFHVTLPVKHPETKDEPSKSEVSLSGAETRRWTSRDMAIIQEKVNEKRATQTPKTENQP